jgi:hypothetical protein
MFTPYPKQETAIQKMVSLLKPTATGYPTCLNSSMTGTGKTLMALETVRRTKQAPFIIAPLSAHATWREWTKTLEIEPIDIVNIEKLRTGKTTYLAKQGRSNSLRFKWSLPPNTLVIFDEIHRGCSGHKTQTGKAVAMFRVQKIPVLMMSATPFSSPLNMRATGFLLGLHDYDQDSYFRWCKANGCSPSPYHRGLEFFRGTRADQALARINNAIRDKIVRLTTTDLAEYFGDNIIQPELINLGDRSTAEADKIYSEMKEELKEDAENIPLVERLRARQRVELLKVPVIIEHIEDLMAQGYSVFVAVNFRDTVAALNDALEDKKISPVIIQGGQTHQERETMVNLFNTDFVQVMVATIDAGGVSISLHHKDERQQPRAAIIIPGDKADQFIQALGRIHRAGGLSPALQKILLAEGTIEEKVYRNLMKKIDNIDTLSDGDLDLLPTEQLV